jgi:hypothetical protein
VTEAEIIKLVLSHLPTIAVAVGVAKIYLKITTFLDKIEKQVTTNTEDIDKLISIHIERHDDDAKKFLRRKVS